MKIQIKSAILALALAPTSKACRKIDSWNRGNFNDAVEPSGGWENGVIYKSTTVGGGVLFEHNDDSVMFPGMNVVTDGSDGESCIMTSGVNPNDLSPKECNDERQSSKRVKVYAEDLTKPIDLVYDLDPNTCPEDDIYRFFLKYINLSMERIGSFTLTLGTGTGDRFEEAFSGAVFTDRDGFELSMPFSDNSLAALFPFGLFGDAEFNNNHDKDGYYDPNARAKFEMVVDSDWTIRADFVSSNYAGLYGGTVESWMPKAVAPWGFFLDDGDDSTEDPVVGDWDGTQGKWLTRVVCDSAIHMDMISKSLLTSEECVPTLSNPLTEPFVLPEDTVQKWRDSPIVHVDQIEDMGNVNVNAHVKVSEDFEGDTLTIRITPFSGGETDAPWLDNFPDFPDGGAMNDPHIKTWAGEWYDYQGECDLLLLHAPYFDVMGGTALDTHIRTKGRYDYSYIESAVVKIGEDTLEVGSFGEYFVNGVQEAQLPATVGGFVLNHTQVDTKKHVFQIDLGHGEDLIVSTFKDMVSVKFDNADKSRFHNSVGLMGEYGGEGRWFGRDGATVIKDPNAFGQEWQIRPEEEDMLFQVSRSPQYPQECIPAAKTAPQRRLGHSLGLDVAEKACAHWKENKAGCISDVMKTGDVDLAIDAFSF